VSPTGGGALAPQLDRPAALSRRPGRQLAA
jgi:hypothetical protein